MILQHLSSVWSATAPAVADHLWQSTVFATLAGLLTLLLRRDHANARYWLWLVSSLKFLFPFALLVSLGSVFVVPSFHAGSQAVAFVVMEQVSQPFVHPAATVAQSVPPSVAASGFSQLLPALLVATWLGGFLTVLLMWCIRWRQMSKVLRGATPSVDGKEVEVLRRLERLAGVPKHIPIFFSGASFEPGIFGMLHPVLILPKGICDRLNENHLQAVLAHEVWHVRRRDNLVAAVHMLVQALFWFHPLVWWLGGRLVEERERACDEQVLKWGSPPHVYAESILKTCELFVESPLTCACGITGANLKKRIVRIMTGETWHKLSGRKKLLLGVTGFLALAVPLGLGLARGSQRQTGVPQNQASPVPGSVQASNERFEVASIKQSKSFDMRYMMIRIMNRPDDGRFYATNVTAKLLVKLAFDVQDSQIVGGPDWIKSERFNIQAKADSATDAELKKLNPLQAKLVKQHMLQELLANRFKLKLRHETKQLPVYALEVAKNGPKIEESKDVTSGPAGGEGLGGPGLKRGVRMQIKGGEQRLDFEDSPIAMLVRVLSQSLGRTVVDKTGLSGRYNFKLYWASDMGRMMMGGPGMMGSGNGAPKAGTAPVPGSSGPSIFTALKEQLGLKLKSGKGPVPVVVIDQIEPPTAN